MFGFKKILGIGLVILASAFPWCALKAEQDAENGRWLEVYYFYPDSFQAQFRNYSEYREDRPNGIAMLNVSAKLIPDARDSKGDFLFGYKAELAMNSHAEKGAINLRFLSEQLSEYDIVFSFSLLDEDGFCLINILDSDKDLGKSHTGFFWNLLPGGKPQTQQTVFNEKKISPSLANRIKKVKVAPCLRRFTPYSYYDENKETSKQ